MNKADKKLFSRGDAVPASGIYVCVPCGFKHSYSEGDHFRECTSCMAGTTDGDQDFVDGFEMWEMLEEKSE